MHKNKYTCPICGYNQLDEPPYSDPSNFTGPSFDICPCCGIEFGYEDYGPKGPPFYHEILRNRWVTGGMKFYRKDLRPDNFDPIDQLRKAGFM